MNRTRSTSFIIKTAARALALILALALALGFWSSLSAALPKGFSAYGYETNTFKDFQPVSLGLENPQFENSSGSLPGAPTGWTETAYQNKDKGSTAMGVLDLDAYNTDENNITAAKLTEYPEFQNGMPKTPFGTVIAAKDANRKILMVNTTKATETVIGYQSSSVTLSANKYFRISTWVKTGDFYSLHGAAIRLNGIADTDIAFSDIQTVNSDTVLTKENLYGWKEYTFYIKTSSIRSETVNLALTVGDYYRGKNQDGGEIIINKTASGYAFFDNIEAYEISPTTYNFAEKDKNNFSSNIIFKDLSLDAADPGFSDPDINLSFAPGQNDVFKNYRINTAKGAGIQTSDIVQPATLNTELSFNAENNRYNLEQTPIAPTGKYSGDGNILVLSSYKGGKGVLANYKRTAVGYESEPVKIAQYSYYRLSVWVNTHKVSDGAGATLVVKTDVQDLNDPEEFITFRSTGSSGNSSNASTYGWNEYAFYIEGSVFRDYTVTLGLWLGQEDNLSSGTAMFGNVRFEKLTSAQYAENSGASAGGAPVTIDGTYPDTGVTNGNFSDYGDPEDNKYPLPVSGWTRYTPSEVSLTGYSRDESSMDSDKIVSGIMPTDEAHFWAHKSDYGTGAVLPLRETGSVLYMASPVLNAFNYTSQQISLTENMAWAITVRMRVDNVTGYGASLVLKDENGIISTIENITDTYSRFHDFTFYVKSDGAARSVVLEIWLGLNERSTFNRTKLSSGNVYVDRVGVSESDDAAYQTISSRYKNDLNQNTAGRDYAVYSYSEMNFTEFDPYDTAFVKYPYLWSVSGPSYASPVGIKTGIFDSANIPAGTGEIPSYFENPDRRDEKQNLKLNNVLLLSNAAKTSSKLSYDRSYTLTAETYYRLEVQLKTDIKIDQTIDPASEAARSANTVKSIGAGLELVGTDFKFENITDTTDAIDITQPEAFKTFTFYLYPGDTEQTIQLAVTLGGENPSEYCLGNVYINDVRFTDITNTLYEEETGKIKKDTDNVLKAAFTAQTEETPSPETPEESKPGDAGNWLLVPSILFSAALLLALGWAVARKFAENFRTRRAHRASAPGGADYDRAQTSARGFKDFTTDTAGETGDKITDFDELRLYEEFDDTAKTEALEKINKERDVEKIRKPAITESPLKDQPAENADAEIQSVTPAEEAIEEKDPSDGFVDAFDD